MLKTWKCVGKVVAAGLLLAGLGMGTVLTAYGAVPLKGKHLEPQTVSNAQLHEALRVLKATKQTLEAADHDYGGHRVDAIKAIGGAQKQLRLALEADNPNHKAGGGARPHVRKPGHPGAKAAGEPEPQAVSNVELADSIAVLNKTIVFLTQADHDYGGHRVNAIHDLQGAIAQLQLALQYIQNKAPKK